MFRDGTYKARHGGSINGVDYWELGRYRVMVDLGEDTPDENRVTYTENSHEPRSRELQFSDGQLVISLEDLTDMALSQSSPEEIARWLWSDKDVRAALVSEMLGAWSDTHWEQDRVALLQGLQRVLVSKRLDRMAGALRSAEYYERRYWELYHALQYYVAKEPRETLAQKERPEHLPPVVLSDCGSGEHTRVSYVQEDPEHKIGSKNWWEARDWWRDKIVEVCRVEERDPVPKILQDVLDLPDRTSPEEAPSMLLVTADELSMILERHLGGPQ